MAGVFEPQTRCEFIHKHTGRKAITLYPSVPLTNPGSRWVAYPLSTAAGAPRGRRSYHIAIPQTSRRMEVQIFGVKKSADTRKALRFFAERRIKTHFVDLLQRAASPGELRRFIERFGAEALLDRDSKRFAELGLRLAMYSSDRWTQKLSEEPLLLRVPLVRYGSRLTIGTAEEEWTRWITSEKGA